MQSSCCQYDQVCENGFMLCMNCGKIQAQSLETSITSYNQSSYYMSKPYSRKSRFEKKVLGLLRCLANHKIDGDLMIFLKTRKIKTPQDLLGEISLYPTKGRRPYSAAMYYWLCLGRKQPVCTDADVRRLSIDFDHIFFAWRRFGFPNPKFPYSYLFAKIVETSGLYSKGMVEMVRFVRQLRCQKRRARYDSLFKKCKEFEYKNVSIMTRNMDSKHDECEEIEPHSEGQTMTREVIQNPKRMSPYDAKGVYKNHQEMQDAIDDGTFNIAKTMYVAKNGEFYFLTYANELGKKKRDKVSMSDLQLHDAQQDKLRASQKLYQMLSDQSNIK